MPYIRSFFASKTSSNLLKTGSTGPSINYIHDPRFVWPLHVTDLTPGLSVETLHQSFCQNTLASH